MQWGHVPQQNRSQLAPGPTADEFVIYSTTESGTYRRICFEALGRAFILGCGGCISSPFETWFADGGWGRLRVLG